MAVYNQKEIDELAFHALPLSKKLGFSMKLFKYLGKDKITLENGSCYSYAYKSKC